MTRTTLGQRIKISVTDGSYPQRHEFLSKLEQILLQSEAHRMGFKIRKIEDFDTGEFFLILLWWERH